MNKYIACVLSTTFIYAAQNVSPPNTPPSTSQGAGTSSQNNGTATIQQNQQPATIRDYPLFESQPKIINKQPPLKTVSVPQPSNNQLLSKTSSLPTSNTPTSTTPPPYFSFHSKEHTEPQNNPKVSKPITMPTITSLKQFANPAESIERDAITLGLDKSHVLTFEKPAETVFITDPHIVNVEPLQGETSGIYILGKSYGETDLIVTFVGDPHFYKYKLNVIRDLTFLQDTLDKMNPLEPITLEGLTSGGVIVKGTVDSAKKASDIMKVVKSFFGDKKESDSSNIINQLQIKDSPAQIKLAVRVAEMNQSITNSLGVGWNLASNQKGVLFGIASGPSVLNFNANNGTLAINTSSSTGSSGSTSSGSSSSSSSSSSSGSSSTTNSAGNIGFQYGSLTSPLDISGVIDALAQNNLATILAEPSLLTLSGKKATFLSGGEFAVVSPSGNSSGNTTVSTTYKPYGVSVSFEPTLIGNNIRMSVNVEVSNIDYSTAITANGYNIPGVTTRRASVSVELAPGQSLAIAGLLSSSASNNLSSLPPLGDIPILGALFRKNEFKNQKFELVIVVTPYLVDPISPPQKVAIPQQGLVWENPLHTLMTARLTAPNEKKEEGENTPPVQQVALAGQAGYDLPII